MRPRIKLIIITKIANAVISEAKAIAMYFSIFILLSSCSSPAVIEKTVPVEIVTTKYIPIPSEILSACPEHPAALANGITNGELRSIALQWQNIYGPCLESHLDAIRALQPRDQ